MKKHVQMIRDTQWLLKDKTKETATLKQPMSAENQKLKEVRARDKELVVVRIKNASAKE